MLRLIQLYVMGCHGTIHQIHSIVRTWDAPLKTLLISGPISCALPTEHLLWHPIANRPQLAGHGIGFCYIGHQTDPYEDPYEDIHGPLELFRVP